MIEVLNRIYIYILKNETKIVNFKMVGVPMGFLDFAPEPPAPTATPVKVTESVNLNCTSNNDARDLSSKCPYSHSVDYNFFSLLISCYCCWKKFFFKKKMWLIWV